MKIKERRNKKAMNFFYISSEAAIEAAEEEVISVPLWNRKHKKCDRGSISSYRKGVTMATHRGRKAKAAIRGKGRTWYN